MYKVPKITGFTADQLAQRLEEALINEQASQEVKEKYTPTYRPVEMPLTSETPLARRMMQASQNDPRNVSPDEKGAVLKAEYEKALKVDQVSRAKANEILENKVVSHLKSMGLTDDYNYSFEYDKNIEGGEDL